MLSYILLTYLMVKTDPKRSDEYSRSLERERGGRGGRFMIQRFYVVLCGFFPCQPCILMSDLMYCFVCELSSSFFLYFL